MPYSPEDLDPSVRKSITKVPRLPFATPLMLGLSRRLYDIGSQSTCPEGVDVDEITSEKFRGLVYRPKSAVRVDSAILWFYGGGHLAGKPDHLNRFAGSLATELRIPVYVPEYRLAPKHPFPADLDDAYDAWRYLLELSKEGRIDPKRILVGGHSAGGGIAASLAQKILDSGSFQPLAQCLFYPMLDDRTAADRDLDTEGHFIWDNRANRKAWSLYLNPSRPGDPELPSYASPARREDFRGLPPAWIGQCSLDLFSSECDRYASRLADSGVPCERYVVKGVPHAFEAIAPDAEISRNFERAAINFVALSFEQATVAERELS